MLSARFLLLPHRDLTADHDQATKTSPYLVPPPSVLKYPTLSPAFPPPHLRFHGAFVQWIDVTQAPSEYFRRKAVVSDLGSVIASQLASPKVRTSRVAPAEIEGRSGLYFNGQEEARADAQAYDPQAR
jgi:hypothetical protein